MLGYLRRRLRKLEVRDATPEQDPDALLTLWPPVLAGDLDPFRPGLAISASAIADAFRSDDASPPYV